MVQPCYLSGKNLHTLNFSTIIEDTLKVTAVQCILLDWNLAIFLHNLSQVLSTNSKNMLENDYETAYYYVQNTVTNKQTEIS